MRKNMDLHESDFFQSDDVLLVNYQCKAKKSVAALSTMHCSPQIDVDSNKKKPKIITDYNKTKSGVDVLDQMLRLYSTKAGTRRWPVCIFYDILNKAAVNAHVLYSETIQPISRKKFIMALAHQLCEPLNKERKRKFDLMVEDVKCKRKRITCAFTSCANKTFSMCDSCGKAFCGKHGIKQMVCQAQCHNCTEFAD